jgi:hypothetical protein
MSSRTRAMAAAASARSWASMKPASSARSCSLGSPPDHSDGRPGSRSRRVARARWSALLAAATLVSSTEAASAADQPSTSRSSSTARWRGGSSWMTARKVSSIVSLATTTTTTASGSASLGATSSSSRSGYGCSQGTSAKECSDAAARRLRRRASRQALVVIRYSHARRFEPGSKPSRRRQARRNASCTTSSASSKEAEHPVAVHVQLAPVARHQGGERGLVAGHRGRGERVVLRGGGPAGGHGDAAPVRVVVAVRARQHARPTSAVTVAGSR